MTQDTANGLARVRSVHSVDETLQHLRSLLDSKGVTVFALVNHSGEAAKAGMAMRPTKLLLFGNPAAGTPVMLARPGIAIDLPLKILIWEDSEGAVWLTWNSAEYLQQRHQLPEALMMPLRAAEQLARQVAA